MMPIAAALPLCLFLLPPSRQLPYAHAQVLPSPTKKRNKRTWSEYTAELAAARAASEVEVRQLLQTLSPNTSNWRIVEALPCIPHSRVEEIMRCIRSEVQKAGGVELWRQGVPSVAGGHDVHQQVCDELACHDSDSTEGASLAAACTTNQDLSIIARLWNCGGEICDVVFSSLKDSECLALALTCKAAHDSMQEVILRRAQLQAMARRRLEIEATRVELMNMAFDLVIRKSEVDESLLSASDTARLANVSAYMRLLARRSLKRREQARRRERLKQVTSLRRSLVDWRVRYYSLEIDGPMADH
eukprot:831464-Pleurochrysis_carterae.AAC.1